MTTGTTEARGMVITTVSCRGIEIDAVVWERRRLRPHVRRAASLFFFCRCDRWWTGHLSVRYQPPLLYSVRGWHLASFCTSCGGIVRLVLSWAIVSCLAGNIWMDILVGRRSDPLSLLFPPALIQGVAFSRSWVLVGWFLLPVGLRLVRIHGYGVASIYLFS